MKTSEQIRKDLEWLGFVYSVTTIAIEHVGTFQIASYRPERDIEVKPSTEESRFTGYLNGERLMNESFSSFEECLVCNIAAAKGDTRGNAGRYFMKMIGG